MVLEKNIFKFRLCISLFDYYLLLEKGVALHKTNLNPLHTMMLCIKFGWNLPSGSREDFVNVFLQFRNNLPLEKSMAHNLNKLESPLPKDWYFMPSLVEIGPNAKMKKVYRQMDDRQSGKLSSSELKRYIIPRIYLIDFKAYNIKIRFKIQDILNSFTRIMGLERYI